MGLWNITVDGSGCHHNGSVNDAEAIAENFVKSLKSAGHNISRAMFTLTNLPEDLNPPAEEAGVTA